MTQYPGISSLRASLMEMESLAYGAQNEITDLVIRIITKKVRPEFMDTRETTSQGER
ncbi:hypothetical protein [Motiliproteus sp. MSK22-1]|uniref:hypothetical protein n=1 Tax=Motiliproteus sp. MSK22-1 TaxID=1897630 RepID=UPI0013012592|nr:hypothetical protein [Motiliproteus sp. MSK22-1]